LGRSDWTCGKDVVVVVVGWVVGWDAVVRVDTRLLVLVGEERVGLRSMPCVLSVEIVVVRGWELEDAEVVVGWSACGGSGEWEGIGNVGALD
jgi:hypothetical protein